MTWAKSSKWNKFRKILELKKEPFHYLTRRSYAVTHRSLMKIDVLIDAYCGNLFVTVLFKQENIVCYGSQHEVSAVLPPHKGKWCESLMFSSPLSWTSCWINNRSGDLKWHNAQDVSQLITKHLSNCRLCFFDTKLHYLTSYFRDRQTVNSIWCVWQYLIGNAKYW